MIRHCQIPQPQRLPPSPRIRNALTVWGQAAGPKKYSQENRRVSTVLTATALERVGLQTQVYLEDLPTKIESLARHVLLLSGIYLTAKQVVLRWLCLIRLTTT